VALAKKAGYSGKKWEEVEPFLMKKSKPDFYRDPVVKYGYCRCTEPVNYVRSVYSIYNTYREMVPK